MARAKKTGITWFDLNPFTVSFAVVTQERAWYEEQDQLGMHPTSMCVWLEPRHQAKVVELENPETGNRRIYMLLDPAVLAEAGGIEAARIVCHESVHVWQAAAERVGERDPSREIEAYMVDFIFASAMNTVAPLVHKAMRKAADKRPERKGK